jgi:hypothetical protein
MRKKIEGLVLGVLLGALIVMALGMFDPAKAQDHVGHAEFHDVYKEWTQPGTSVGCCNAKYDDTGKNIGGDCYPTEAWVINGTWYAFRDDGDVIAIPDDRIVRQINPDQTGSRAHLCFNYGKVLCFAPPTGAM